jgi:putative sigma-54 modulation protein
MNTKIIERKYQATDRMKEKMELKLSKFEKIFDSEADIQLVLTKEKEREICEITIFYKDTIFRVEETTRDMYESFDECIENLKKQIRKYKTKLENKFKGKKYEDVLLEFDDFVEEDEESEFEIIKTKRISVKPMFVEEAILQMNLLNHEFFVFKNAETSEIDIVYKRKDGKYGIIETN